MAITGMSVVRTEIVEEAFHTKDSNEERLCTVDVTGEVDVAFDTQHPGAGLPIVAGMHATSAFSSVFPRFDRESQSQDYRWNICDNNRHQNGEIQVQHWKSLGSNNVSQGP